MIKTDLTKPELPTTSVFLVILLSILTCGLYQAYWYINRTRAVFEYLDRKVPPVTYGFAFALPVSFFLVHFGCSMIPVWFSETALGLAEIVYFFWSFWLANILARQWREIMKPHKFLSFLCLLSFHIFFIQYKLNKIAESNDVL